MSLTPSSLRRVAQIHREHEPSAGLSVGQEMCHNFLSKCSSSDTNALAPSLLVDDTPYASGDESDGVITIRIRTSTNELEAPVTLAAEVHSAIRDFLALSYCPMITFGGEEISDNGTSFEELGCCDCSVFHVHDDRPQLPPHLDLLLQQLQPGVDESTAARKDRHRRAELVAARMSKEEVNMLVMGLDSQGWDSDDWVLQPIADASSAGSSVSQHDRVVSMGSNPFACLLGARRVVLPGPGSQLQAIDDPLLKARPSSKSDDVDGEGSNAPSGKKLRELCPIRPKRQARLAHPGCSAVTQHVTYG